MRRIVRRLFTLEYKNRLTRPFVHTLIATDDDLSCEVTSLPHRGVTGNKLRAPPGMPRRPPGGVAFPIFTYYTKHMRNVGDFIQHNGKEWTIQPNSRLSSRRK